MPFGSDYYLGCCLLRLRQLAAAEKTFLDSRVLSSQFQQAQLKTQDATNELAVMSARFQLLLCLRVQSKLLDICMLDNVLTFFENWCSTTKNYENSDPALALVEYNLALVAMSYRRLERAVVLFERALANHEIKSKQHEEALVPLCRVLEGLKKSMPVTQGPSASASKMKFDHKVRVMHAKLSLCEASHCATYTLEAEQLAKDVLAWTKRQQQRNEEEEEGEGEKEEEEQQGENSYKEPTDEQKQTPEQDKSLQSQEIQE
ncbi:hypothetical protein F4801DRAFT_583398 [Xylaria longipes]|nr:hypothetical protein F4801DRAFT_583398 [Xylaria longipes]